MWRLILEKNALLTKLSDVPGDSDDDREELLGAANFASNASCT